MQLQGGNLNVVFADQEGDDNVGNQTQLGENNRANSDQDGDGNNVMQMQFDNYQDAYSRQDGDEGTVMQTQMGHMNYATVNQYDGLLNKAIQNQDGQENDATVDQGLFAFTEKAEAMQKQEGIKNYAYIAQEGYHNKADQNQSGDYHDAIAEQDNASNEAFQIQKGYNNVAGVAQNWSILEEIKVVTSQNKIKMVNTTVLRLIKMLMVLMWIYMIMKVIMFRLKNMKLNGSLKIIRRILLN